MDTLESGTSLEALGRPPLRQTEYASLRALVYQETGITLGDNKQDMVAARLAKRLRHLRLSSYGDYYRYLLEDDPSGAERQELINCITTNKTDFFREAHHFDFLREEVFPKLRSAGGGRLRIWSAGCSTGEEPYTLAMTVLDHFGPPPGWDVQLLATDIDTAVLAQARRGVYARDRVEGLSSEVLRKHFLRGTGTNEGLVSVRPEPRRFLTFEPLNFIEGHWPLRDKFDLLFCRNVMIYFDRATQQRLLERFAERLLPGGYLFLGHSENMHGLGELYEPLGRTIFRRRGELARPQPARPQPAQALEARTLIVGDVIASERPVLLKTLLGSCVAACVYDPDRGVGGMNHFSLPGAAADAGASTRYGVNAMELLINEVMRRGGDRRQLKAKVFGGAKVLNLDSEAMNIGSRNARFVLEFLQAEGIEVTARRLGGDTGLHVHFYPHQGKALVKPLDGGALAELAREEEQFTRIVLRDLARPVEDNITLF